MGLAAPYVVCRAHVLDMAFFTFFLRFFSLPFSFFSPILIYPARRSDLAPPRDNFGSWHPFSPPWFKLRQQSFSSYFVYLLLETSIVYTYTSLRIR